MLADGGKDADDNFGTSAVSHLATKITGELVDPGVSALRLAVHEVSDAIVQALVRL